MKPNSSMLKLSAAIILAMGLAACNDDPEGVQNPDVMTEQGQGDVDLYGPDADQRGTTTEPGMTAPVVDPVTPQDDPSVMDPAGQGDVDLYGEEPAATDRAAPELYDAEPDPLQDNPDMYDNDPIVE